jgi:hypothetical protein
MANSFSKEEIVAFDQVLEGFDDALILSKAFNKYNLSGADAERTGNIFWRPQPYIAQVFSGIDQSANFGRNYTQLSVPATLGYQYSVPLTLSATELRDALQEKRLGQAALQGLASKINVSCSNLAALQGTIVVKRATAAAGFDDVAAIDTAMNRMGISMDSRKAFFSSGDYNSMASNLASRVLDNSKSLSAYERAYVGNVAGFDTYKLDYAYRLTAAVATTVTITNSQPLYYTPAATANSTDGLTKNNVDNRYQTVNLAVGGTTGIKAGDCFTIAGVNEVHHITKADTGSLKTFRIISQATGTAGATGNYVISPPIISGTGGTDPELQYQNVTAAPSNGAAITFLNTVAAAANPFWQADAFEIIPGKYMPDPNSGMAVMSATTDSGITVTMAKQATIGTLDTKYRWDAFYGLVNKQPEMTGIELFSQT